MFYKADIYERAMDGFLTAHEQIGSARSARSARFTRDFMAFLEHNQATVAERILNPADTIGLRRPSPLRRREQP